MELQLKGRINSMHRVNTSSGMFYQTILDTPAPDQYSRPSSYKIVSDSQLGQPGEEISITCELSGFVRKKPYTEKSTGESKVFFEGNTNFRFLRYDAAKKPTAVNQ